MNRLFYYYLRTERTLRLELVLSVRLIVSHLIANSRDREHRPSVSRQAHLLSIVFTVSTLQQRRSHCLTLEIGHGPYQRMNPSALNDCGDLLTRGYRLLQ